MGSTQVLCSYRVRVLPLPQQIEVELLVEGASPGSLLLQTPTWVPGAFGFMKYGRDLFEVKARDASTGKSLAVRREGWAGYRIDGLRGPVVVSWRAGASDPTWGELAGLVGHQNALLLATRYLFPPGLQGPCRVRYLLPEGWALHHPGGALRLEPGLFEYPCFTALLDSPVACGRFDRMTRSAQGADFHFVFLDRALGFDLCVGPFLDSLMEVVESCRALFGGFPFEDYTFLFTFDPRARWGLEHPHATTIALGPECFFDAAARSRAVRVCAHELFHAWNGCRLKPAPLGTPDLSQGSFPEALWVTEGLTRYYEFLLMVRAGQLAPADLFSNLVNFHRQLTSHPSYGRVSALDSSRGTFLNHNQYPGSVNATIDYYDKGMLIAFDLDAALRTGTPESTLDERMAALFSERAGKGDGLSHAEAKSFFSRGRPDVAELLRREVEEPAGLSTPQLLARLGFAVEQTETPYLGLILAKQVGPAIANVTDDSPAGASGIAPDDEIVRVGGFPFSPKALAWAVGHLPEVGLEVRRGHACHTFTIRPARRRSIGRLAWSGSVQQAERIRAWLRRPDFDPAPGEEISLASHENFHGIQSVL